MWCAYKNMNQDKTPCHTFEPIQTQAQPPRSPVCKVCVVCVCTHTYTYTHTCTHIQDFKYSHPCRKESRPRRSRRGAESPSWQLKQPASERKQAPCGGGQPEHITQITVLNSSLRDTNILGQVHMHIYMRANRFKTWLCTCMYLGKGANIRAFVSVQRICETCNEDSRFQHIVCVYVCKVKYFSCRNYFTQETSLQFHSARTRQCEKNIMYK